MDHLTYAERTTPAVEGKTIGVFWDVVGCPFPDGMNPDLIYQKIYTDLIGRGCRPGTMSIWAYVDEKQESWREFLRNKTWKTRIYFLPRG